MPAKFTSLHAVKSAGQRALASYWDQLAAGRRFPAFSEFKLELCTNDPGQLVAWNVEGVGRQQKFRVLYQGEQVAEVFNANWLGKTMEQVVPRSLRRFTIEATKECAASGCLVYTIVSTIDTNEHRVDCEALLLPFGSNGSVEQILSSVRLKSLQGTVQRKNILSNFQIHTDVVFSGKIKSGFVKAGASSKLPAIAANETDTEPGRSLRVLPTIQGQRERANSAVGEERRAPRRNILSAGRISFADESKTCTVRNISATGALIEGANLSGIPDTFTLVLEMETIARPCTVVWRKKTQIGVRFG